MATNTGILAALRSVINEAETAAHQYYVHALANGAALWAVADTDLSKLHAAVVVAIANGAAFVVKAIQKKL